jgi:TRAP transporter TAXI family solute receptor
MPRLAFFHICFRAHFGARFRAACRALLRTCVLGALAGPAAGAEEPFFDKLLTLGTGTAGGAFWPIGESLCEQVNQQRTQQRVRCIATSTAGSVYNINAVANGRLQLGIAQEDLVLGHVNNRGVQGFDALRQVAVLHESPVSMVVRADANVQRLEQIKGLRINLGNRGSGQFTVTTALLKAIHLQESDFAAVLHEPTSAFERLFCGGKVDVVVEIVPHPVALFEKLLACGGRLLELPPEVAARLIASNPVFRPMAIAANSYAGQAQAVPSVGVRNLLISHTRVSEESIARLTRLLAERTKVLKQQQPLLATMPPVLPAETAFGPVQMPVHDGVLRAMRD